MFLNLYQDSLRVVHSVLIGYLTFLQTTFKVEQHQIIIIDHTIIRVTSNTDYHFVPGNSAFMDG